MNLKNIKTASQSQIQKFFSLLVAEVSILNPAFMNWSDQAIVEALARYQFYCSVTESDEIRSMICYQQSGDVVEILALGTTSHYQGRGYAQSLLRSFAIDCGSTSNVISLEVHAENARAIRFYEKCGFKTIRIRKKYYSDGADAIVMDLDLKPVVAKS